MKPFRLTKNHNNTGIFIHENEMVQDNNQNNNVQNQNIPNDFQQIENNNLENQNHIHIIPVNVRNQIGNIQIHSENMV